MEAVNPNVKQTEVAKPSPKIKYTLASGNNSSVFFTSVDKLIGRGYEPIGGVSIRDSTHNNYTTYYNQAMIKREPQAGGVTKRRRGRKNVTRRRH